MTYDANAEAVRLARIAIQGRHTVKMNGYIQGTKEISEALQAAYQAGKKDGIEEIQMLREWKGNRMSVPIGAPQDVYDHLWALPQECVGDLYATIKNASGEIKEYKVPVWGQVCDGKAHDDAVCCFLHNEFPDRGNGCTYLSWRADPSNPEQNKHPRTGIVQGFQMLRNADWTEADLVGLQLKENDGKKQI